MEKFPRIPLELEIGELEEYLYLLIQRDTDSLSSFKHLVYGLRKLYQLFDKEGLHKEADLLPVKYFYVVFTVPDKLNSLFLNNQVAMYNLLFSVV